MGKATDAKLPPFFYWDRENVVGFRLNPRRFMFTPMAEVSEAILLQGCKSSIAQDMKDLQRIDRWIDERLQEIKGVE